MSDETGHGDCGEVDLNKICLRCTHRRGEHRHWDLACVISHSNGSYEFSTTHKFLSSGMVATEARPSGSNEQVSPDHYRTGDIECIDALRSMLGDDGFVIFCRGVIAQYVWRFGRKDDPLMEISKIQVYARWIKDTLDGKTLSK